MKKLVSIAAFILIQFLGHAQFNVGANINLQLPQKDYKIMSTFGYGGSVSMGYNFKQTVDLSFVYSIFDYTGMIKGLCLNSKTAELKFFLLKKTIRPYIGCGAGMYQKVNKISSTIIVVKNDWGLEPKIGLLLDSKILTDLFVDTSVSYFKTKIKHNTPEAFNLSIGLMYMIDFQKIRN